MTHHMSVERASREIPKDEKPAESPTEAPVNAALEAHEAFRKSVEILRQKPVDLPQAETAAEVFAKAEQIAFTERASKMIKSGDIEGAMAAMEERNKNYPGKPKGTASRAA